MPKTFTVEGGQQVAFPDDMSMSEIEEVMRKQFPPDSAPEPAAEPWNPAPQLKAGDFPEQPEAAQGPSADIPYDPEAFVPATPRQPLRPEERTTYGGPPLQTGGGPLMMPRPSLPIPFLSEAEEVPVSVGMTESVLPIPEAPPVAQVPTGDMEKRFMAFTPLGKALKQVMGQDVAAQVMRESINQGLAIPKFLTSPMGLASIPAAGALPFTTTGYFAFDTLKGLKEHLEHSIENWSDMPATEKARAIVQGLGMATISGLLTHGGMNLAKARLQGQPAPEGAREIAGTAFPWSKPAMLEKSLVKPSAEPQVEAPTFEKPAFQHPPLPKREGPEMGRGPFRNIEGVFFDADGNRVDSKGVIVVKRPTPAPSEPQPIPTPPLAGTQTQKDLEGKVGQAATVLPAAAAEAAKDVGAFGNVEFAPTQAQRLLHGTTLEQRNPLGLRVAAKTESGKILIGKPGDLHMNMEIPEGSELGFAMPDGSFLTREEAATRTLTARKGEPDALQKQSANEEMLRNARLRRESELQGVRPQDVVDQGAAGAGKAEVEEIISPEMEAAYEKAQGEPSPQTYEQREREALDEISRLGTGVHIEDHPVGENEPFGGRIAYARSDGTIGFNRAEFRNWISKIPPKDRSIAIQGLMGEEHIHTKTDPKDALTYWKSLSGIEQTLVKKVYSGNVRGEKEPGKKFTERQLGFEATRLRIQQLARQTPREVAERVGLEKWGIKGLLALDTTVFNIRKALGTDASKVQLEILDRIQFNIKVAKSAIAGAQMQDQPEAFNWKEYHERKAVEDEMKRRFWARYGMEQIDVLRNIGKALKEHFADAGPTDVRLSLAYLPPKWWPEEIPSQYGSMLKDFWRRFPKERLEDAEVGLALGEANLEKRKLAAEEHWAEERLKDEKLTEYQVSEEAIEESQEKLDDSRKFVAQLRKDLAGPENEALAEAFNKKKWVPNEGPKEPPEFPKDLEEIIVGRSEKGNKPSAEVLAMGYQPNLFSALDHYAQTPLDQWKLPGKTKKRLLDWFNSARGTGYSREEILASNIRGFTSWLNDLQTELKEQEKFAEFLKGAIGPESAKDELVQQYEYLRKEVQVISDGLQDNMRYFKELTGGDKVENYLDPHWKAQRPPTPLDEPPDQYKRFTDTSYGEPGQMDLPFAYNKKRKQAEQDTASLGLSFGKMTTEGFKKDLTPKPTGAEVGLKPHQSYALNVINEALKFIEEPIHVESQRKIVPGKLDEQGQPIVRTTTKVQRPRLRQFADWVKANHPNITPTQIYEIWQPLIWDHLIKAPAERLKQWVLALGLREKLEGKGYERREMREIPEYTVEGDIAKQQAAPAKPMKTEMGLELPMKEALPPITRAQQINDLRKEAEMWEERAKKVQPTRPLIQESMFGDLGVEEITTPSKKLKIKNPRTAREMLEKAKQLRDRADAMEVVADISTEGQVSRPEYQRPKDYRTKVITEIGVRLLKEAEPRDLMLSPKDVRADEINWDNPNTKVSPYHELGDLSLFDRERLEEMLTDQARQHGEPVSWSRRLVGLVNPKSKEVVLSTVYKDGRKGLMVPDPTGGGDNMKLDSVMKRWQPFVSILRRDPLKDFRKGFRNMSEFDDYIGAEARDQKAKEFEELKDVAPPEIAEQAYEDELARNEMEDANRDAILAEERVDPKDLEAAVAARFGEEGGGEGVPETKVTEGEGGMYQGPHADIVRESTGEGETRRNAPITSAEALAVLDLYSSDRKQYKVDSMLDVRKAIENLADRAKNKTLSPKNWLAINALRKAARSIYAREQERIRMEKENTKLTEARKALGIEEEPEFTIEDAYRNALTEFYEIVRDTDTDEGFIEKAMGRFAEETREVGTAARGAASRTARELALKRTVLRPDVMGGPPKEVEVPVRPPTQSQWKQYETLFRHSERFSDDPYTQWLARYSRKLPEPMPLGGVRGLAENVPKLDQPDLKWKGSEAQKEPYIQTPVKTPSAALEKRNITLSEYDSMHRDPKYQPSPLAAQEKLRYQRWLQRHQDIEPADLDSPAAWNKKREGLRDLISAARNKMRDIYKRTWDRPLDIDRPVGRVYQQGLEEGAKTDLGLLIGGIPRAYQSASKRHVIKDRLYYLLDSLDNAAAEYALRSGNAIKLASMDVLGEERTRKLFKENKALGLKRREAAKVIIAATEPLKEMGERVLDENGQPIMRVKYSNFQKFKNLTQVGIDNADKWIKSNDLQKRIYGRKWKRAAQKLQAEVLYAEKEYRDATAQGRRNYNAVMEQREVAELAEKERLKREAAGRLEFVPEEPKKGRVKMTAEEKAAAKAIRDAKEAAESVERDAYEQAAWQAHPMGETIREFHRTMKDNINFQIENGIIVRERENYVPGRYEGEVFSDNMISFGEQKILGLQPRKSKAFNNYYEAIANIKGPYIPVNGDLAELAQSTIVASHRMINRRTWEMSAKNVKDPHTGRPIMKSPKQIKVDTIIKDPETGEPTVIQQVKFDSPDPRYELVYPNNDKGMVPVAVLPSYAAMMRAAIAPSMMRRNMVTQTGLAISAGLKHGLVLIFDSFHPFRLAQYGLAAGGDTPGWKGFFKPNKTGYEGGYSALNFNPEDLAKAVDSGWIPKKSAEWAMAKETVNVINRRPGPLGFRQYIDKERVTHQEIARKMTHEWGMNAVKLSDAMYRDAIKSIPFIGTRWHDMLAPSNRFIFDRITTGLMVETAVRNFTRMNKENPTMDYDKLGRFVAKDVNILFGNMGRQGVFRNQTFRDFATMILLAPMWREGLIQKDLRFIGRSAGWVGSRMAYALKKSVGKETRTWQELPKMGTLGRAYARGLLTYFILAQAINLISSKHRLTWNNPEEDHSMDAWMDLGAAGGAWVSTFGVFGEFMHQAMTMVDKKPTVIEAIIQLGVNALGPVGRAGLALGSGKDPEGSKATRSWQWGKNVLSELMPAPITATIPLKAIGHAILPTTFASWRPNEPLQRLLGIFGVKAQLPTKWQNQVLDLVGHWAEDMEIPRDSIIMQPTDQDSYTKLRRAIWVDDIPKAREIYQDLAQNYVKRHEGSDFQDAMDHIEETMNIYTERAWTGNEELDEKFQEWVIMKHPKRMEILFNAQFERSLQFGKFQMLLPQLALPK